MQVGQQSTYEDDTKLYLHVLMTQMSVKAGMKKFGKKEMTCVKRSVTIA